MSHFYGTLQGSRGEATRCATKNSGITTCAAGWQGCIAVYLSHDKNTGEDIFDVYLEPWQGSGGHSQLLAHGVLNSTLPVFGVGETPYPD